MADNFQQPARPVTPTPPALATSTTYAPSPLPVYTPADIEKSQIKQESGGRDTAVSPQGARGYGQILPGTFKQYALPGENINNPIDNRNVYHRIMADYASRWPNDPARWMVAYFSGPGNVSPPGSPYPWKVDKRDVNESTSAYVRNALAGLGHPTGVPDATTSSTTTPATAAAAPSPPTTVGGMLGMLNDPGPSGKSTMDSLGGMAPSSSAQQPPPLNVQGQMAAGMGNIRQQQIAQQAAAQMAALQQRAAQPLSWSSRPPGATAGPQSAPPVQTMMGGQQIPMPGTTINTMGNFYGG